MFLVWIAAGHLWELQGTGLVTENVILTLRHNKHRLQITRVRQAHERDI